MTDYTRELQNVLKILRENLAARKNEPTTIRRTGQFIMCSPIVVDFYNPDDVARLEQQKLDLKRVLELQIDGVKSDGREYNVQYLPIIERSDPPDLNFFPRQNEKHFILEAEAVVCLVRSKDARVGELVCFSDYMPEYLPTPFVQKSKDLGKRLIWYKRQYGWELVAVEDLV